ncbi:MAG: efflux RND transporter periplasmic adaptor subunit [Gemmatimonadales bacterium]
MKREFLIAVLILPTAACAKKAEESAKTQAVVAARVVPVVAQKFTETVDAVGTVAPRAGHVASLAAPSPTRVSNVFVFFGAHVKAGDRLVEFEQAAFDAAAKGADASLAAAEKAMERTKRLADAGVVPRKDAEAAAADLGVAQLNAVNSRRARELSTLRSPIDGVVTRLSAVLGASADPTQVMVEVSDPTTVDATLTLSPADAARVRIGDRVALHAGAAASGAAIASGRVADVSAAVDTSSRGVPARVEIESGAGALRIGQTLFGRITIAEHDRAVVVPLEALVPTGEGFKVFVVDEKGIAESRPVKIGGRTDHTAWITDGLKAGENIVTQGAYGVDDSTKVQTMEDGRSKTEGTPDAGSRKPEEKSEKPATASKKP